MQWVVVLTGGAELARPATLHLPLRHYQQAGLIGGIQKCHKECGLYESYGTICRAYADGIGS